MIKGERLTTLGFGIPDLLKIGEVGYFPEQFFMSTGMEYDGDVIYRRSDNTNYFVDLKHNVFIKYYQSALYDYLKSYFGCFGPIR